MSKAKKEEIDAVQTYQSIKFEKSEQRFFSTRDDAKKTVDVKFHNTLSAIVITSEKDQVIVPLTNVSAIYLKSPIKQEAIADAKKDKEVKNKISSSQTDQVKRPI